MSEDSLEQPSELKPVESTVSGDCVPFMDWAKQFTLPANVVTHDTCQDQLQALQARLAQCEQERDQEAHGRKLYSDELCRAKNRICQEAGIDPERGYEAGIAAFKADRDAALERVKVLEDAIKAFGDAHGLLSDAVTWCAKRDALLALRAGMR